MVSIFSDPHAAARAPTLSAVPESRWPLDTSPEPLHGRQRPMHAKAALLSCAVLAVGALVLGDPLRLHARCLAAAAADACASARLGRALALAASCALYAAEAARSSTLRYVADRRSPAQARRARRARRSRESS